MSRRQAPARTQASHTSTRRPAARCLLAVICLMVVAPHASSAHTQSVGLRRAASLSQVSLTPLQRQIEKERVRLSSPDAEERRDAVQRLGAMARPESSRAAASALGDASAAVRALAARAVLSLPGAEVAALLIPLLRDKDEFVRRETAYALGLARSPVATPALVVALERDKEAGVRGAAAVALGQIGDSSAVAALSATVVRRVRSSGFFSRITRSRTEENEFVRRAAAISLGQIGRREAVPALVEALSNPRAGDDVRREAARSLGLIGDASAIPALRAALTARDPYLSEIAQEALRKLDPNSTAPARPT